MLKHVRPRPSHIAMPSLAPGDPGPAKSAGRTDRPSSWARRATTGLLVAISACLLTPTARAVTIDFNSGVAPNPVGATYAGLGVTFSNAEFSTSLGQTIRSISAGFQPKVGSAIVATFSFDVATVSILGLDVGENGIRIDAYDSVVGGSLVNFDQFIGPDVGVGTSATVSAAGAAIRRVEFYQPFSVVGDGVVWDDFVFTAVPEPGSAMLLGLGLVGLAGRRRRQRL